MEFLKDTYVICKTCGHSIKVGELEESNWYCPKCKAEPQFTHLLITKENLCKYLLNLEEKVERLEDITNFFQRWISDT